MKDIVISNPGVNYGRPKTPLVRYIGEVLSFERRVRFGREMPCPWWKVYECRADSVAMATPLLAKQAYRDGYALGGVQDIRPEEKE